MADKPQIVLGGMLDKQATKKMIQEQLKGMSKEDRQLLLDVKLDEQKFKKVKQELGNLSKETLTMTQNGMKLVEVMDKGLGRTLTVTKQLNTETGKMEATQEKVTVNFKELNKEATKFNNQWQGRFQESIKSMTSISSASKQMSEYYKGLEKEFGTESQFAKLSADLDMEKRKTAQKMEQYNWDAKNYKLTSIQKNKLEEEKKVIQNILNTQAKTTKEIEEQNRELSVAKSGMQSIVAEAKSSGKTNLNPTEYIKNAVKATASWFVATTIFYQALHRFQDGVQTIFEFDKAMTELKKVSDDSNESLDAFGKTAEAIGAKVGRTSTEVVQATGEFVKMGYTLQQSAKLAEDALVLTNVGDGFTDVNDASEALVTTLKGFNLDASESVHIIDSLNELSNKYAVNSVDLAEALKRSSAAMAMTGNTLDETLAMYTAGIEVLQSPEKVSRGLTTISQRLRGLSEEGEKIVGLTPKLQDTFDKYAKGVKITADDGSLRSTYDILVDLSKVWGTLTSKQQQYIGEQVAGKDQVKTLAAILQNQKVMLEASTVSMESNGSAAKENAIYLQSLEGRVKSFNQAMENMWKNTINSEALKQIVSLGTSLVGVADSVGLLNIAFTALAVTLALKVLPSIDLATLSIRGLATSITTTLIRGITAIIPLIFSLEGAVFALAGAWLYVSYQQSEFIKTQAEATQRMNDATTASQQNMDTAHRLIESISDLNGVQNLNEQQQSRLHSVISELQKLYPTIFSNLDTEKDKVGALIEGYNALKKASIEADIARAKTEMNTAKSAYDKVMATTKLASGQGRTAQANARFGLGAVDFSKAVNANNNAEIKATLDRYYAANTTYNKAKDELSGYNKVTIEDFIPTTTYAPDDNIIPDGKTKKTSTEYLSTLNLQYQTLENQVSLTTQAIKENQDILSNLDTDKEKIEYLKKEVELNKQLQSNYASLAKAKRGEMSDIQSKLNALGMGVSIDKEDNITIKNWKNINSLSEDNRKIADDLISKLQSLSSEVKGYGDSWSDANNKIISDNKEIAKIIKDDILDKFNKLKDSVLDSISKDIDKLESDMKDYKTLSDKDIKKLETDKQNALDALDIQQELAQTALDNYNDSIDKQEEVNKLKEIDAKISEENLSYQESLLELLNTQSDILNNKNVRQLNAEGTAFEFIADPQALQENADAIQDLTDEHTQTLADLATERNEEVKSQAIKAEQDRLQAEIDRISKEKKLLETSYNNQIDNLKTTQQATLDSYTNRIEALKTFQTSLKEKTDEGNAITKADQEKLFDDLLKSDNTYFTNKIAGYQSMVNSINAILGGISGGSTVTARVATTVTQSNNTLSPTSSSSSSSGSSTSVTGKANSGISQTTVTVPKYHDGIELGLVGGANIPKDYETLAMLAKGEGVFTTPQLKNLSSFANTATSYINNTAKATGDLIIQSLQVTSNNATDFVKQLQAIRLANI